MTTEILSRGVDDKTRFVVTTRRGDVLTTKRFYTLAEADAYVVALGLETPDQLHAAKRRGGKLSAFNRPLKEWT